MSAASRLSAALIALALAGSARAASYHDLEKNRQPCADCHILHHSEGGAPPAELEPGGPFPQLLVRAVANKLCLFCHDGSNPNAPDVLDPVSMYGGSGDEHSGAGAFANAGGADNPNGHDLGLEKPVPFGSGPSQILTCASCHDPHGTQNYRNVVTAPRGGAGTPVVMGADVHREAPAGDPPSAAASTAAYKESNEGYRARSSRWCAECHDALQPHVGGNVRVASHHLVDVPINGAGYPTDPTHWEAGTGSGFGVATGDGVEGVPRLRFQVPAATDFPSSKVVSPGNQVLCASCHLAHGGRHAKGLAWPYRDPGSPADAISGCQQCHNY
ncbi:MAG TPA: hypothetical protein VLS93_16030 [Anaeromyxobacteraceae bacterium]|nr:hypothetical protein [Anaeromyxobacteraceae bacterium]